MDNENGLYSVYRFHVKDPIYFQNNLRVTVQQIGHGLKKHAKQHFKEDFIPRRPAGFKEGDENSYFELSDDYCSTAFWFQTLPTTPFPDLPDRRERSSDLLNN